MGCPYLDECSFTEQNFGFLHKIIRVNYCDTSCERCERKKLKDNGKEVPLGLLPNGEIFDNPHSDTRKTRA